MRTYSLSKFYALSLLLTSMFFSGCSGESQHGANTPTVTFIEIAPQKAVLTSDLPGRLSAFFVAEVRPQVGGIIQKRLFEEGSIVQEGQVLYQIDPSLFRADYDSAKAALARAEASAYTAKLLAQRYAGLVKSNAVSKQEYDDAQASYKSSEADVEAAKAALESARINLEYTKVTAPVTGRIGKSSVTAGALVTQNQAAALATIQQLDKMYFDGNQAIFEVMEMKRKFGDSLDKEVVLKFQDGSEYSQKGKLQFYDVTVSVSTDMVNVRALFQNDNGLLSPNMYARAIITEGMDENAILIPQQAISKNQRGESTVVVLKPEAGSDLYTTETRTIVSPRVINVNQAYVTEGLNIGEKIMVEGIMKIRPGVPVKAVPYTAVTQETPHDDTASEAAQQ